MSVTDVTGSAGEGFRIGRVIGRTFSAISANALIVWPVSVVFIAAPAAGLGYLTLFQQGGPLGNLLRRVVVGLFAVFVHGVTIKACLDQFAGKRRRLGRSLGAGVSNYAGMFGVRWLTNIGALFGLILLIAPGLIWATSWIVAGPALIANDTKSQGPLARSAQLTKGSRWSILGLMLIFFVAYLALSFAGGIAVGVSWRWIAPLLPAGTTVEVAASVLGSPVVLMPYEVFAAAGAAAIYWELKLVRESGGVEAVSRVFA